MTVARLAAKSSALNPCFGGAKATIASASLRVWISRSKLVRPVSLADLTRSDSVLDSSPFAFSSLSFALFFFFFFFFFFLPLDSWVFRMKDRIGEDRDC